MKTVVYTAITGNKDILKEKQIIGQADFICFTDNEDLQSNVWKIRKACNLFIDPNRNAKIHKILAHMYLTEYDYSIWIDGNRSLLINPEYLIEKYLQNKDIAVFVHRDRRNCLYKEAKICIDKRKDDVDLIEKQTINYKNNDYPVDNGLYECGIILRKHTPKIEELNNLWWAEICRYSKRDQISFNYVINKLKIFVEEIDGIATNSNYLKILSHNENLITNNSKKKF